MDFTGHLWFNSKAQFYFTAWDQEFLSYRITRKVFFTLCILFRIISCIYLFWQRFNSLSASYCFFYLTRWVEWILLLLLFLQTQIKIVLFITIKFSFPKVIANNNIRIGSPMYTSKNTHSIVHNQTNKLIYKVLYINITTVLFGKRTIKYILPFCLSIFSM